jgi:hypothetical protein
MAPPRRRADRGRSATSSPVRPWTTSVRSPPTAAATTGRAAGRGLQGHETERLGTARHDHHVCRPVPGGEQVVGLGVHASRCGPPRPAGRRGPAPAPVASGPSAPLGPPTTTSRAVCPRASSSARAPMATSRPLRGWMRPTNSSRWAPPDRGPGPAGPRPGGRERRRRAPPRAAPPRCGRGRPRRAGGAATTPPASWPGSRRSSRSPRPRRRPADRAPGRRSRPSPGPGCGRWTPAAGRGVLHPVAGHARQPVVGVDDVDRAVDQLGDQTPR